MKKFYGSVAILSLFTFLTTSFLHAQLPSCNYFYYHSGSTIYQYNTATNTSSVNSISLPAGAAGLAVSNNLNGGTPAVTFYTTVGGNYYYYNGSTWVNTGHFTGNSSAVNIGGAGPYIYNLNGIGQQVYRYDGTGPGVLVLSIPGWGGPYDCIGDASGNFYILNTSTPPFTLTMYSPNGTQMCVYNLVGSWPSSSAGGGYAIVNNVLYADIGGTDCYGTISGNTITYAGSLTLSISPADMANCEFPPLLVSIATPGALTCASPTTVLNASSTLTGTTWSWSGPGVVSGGNTSSPTVNQPGTYTVTVTGTGGCTSSATATCVVTQTGGITLNAATTNVLCNGATTGAIDLTPSNGMMPYTYLWNTGGTMQDPSGMPAGTYTVTVTDNSGCSMTATYTITQPAQPVGLATSSTPALCGATDGSANVIASGGTGAYTYSWAPSGGNAANAPNLGAGNYTVTVTDANSCTQTSSVTVSSTSAVIVTVDTIVPVTCTGGADGMVSVTASNGAAPYAYSWSSGSAANTATGLSAGIYTVTVTDNTGCTTTATCTIPTGNNPPAIDLEGDVLTGCVVHCVHFDVPAAISTGNLQTYQWMVNGTVAGNSSTLDHCFTSAGSYDIALSVTDTLGCSNSITKPAYINVQDFPVADFMTDKNIYLLSEPDVHVVDQSTNAATLSWDMDDGTMLANVTDFHHIYQDTGTFCIMLVAASPLGCTDTTTHCIVIQGESYYYIPNSFTPNGDGLNDVFYPAAQSIKKYSMQIFDRWGEIIFTSAKDDDVWNGRVKNNSTLAPQGVYVYKIVITDAQGQEHGFMGHVNLLR